MKNKRGFTVIEVITLIAIVVLIIFVIVPSIMKLINSDDNKELDLKKEEIIGAAEFYAMNNRSIFENSNVVKIKVGQLVYEGYIPSDGDSCKDSRGCVINPKDNSSMNDMDIYLVKSNMLMKATFEDPRGN